MSIIFKPVLSYIIAISAGILLTLSFSPFDYYYCCFIAIVLFKFCLNNTKPQQAMIIGLLFGLGLFGSGVSWVYVSMMLGGNGFSIIPFIMTLLFCSFWALFPVLFAYLYVKFQTNNLFDNWSFATFWLFVEYIKGEWVLDGFPWMQVAYSQVDSPLAGYIPIFGSYGTGFIVVFISALLATTIQKKQLLLFIFIVGIFVTGYFLNQIDWVKRTGTPFKATLIQGNIAQKDKWQADNKNKTLKQYYDDTKEHWDSDLIIWPETAIPAYYAEVKDNYLLTLNDDAVRHKAAVVISLPYRGEQNNLYNSVFVIGEGAGVYKKIHLLPFGEYLPWQPLSGYLLSYLDVRLGQFSRGEQKQTLLTAAGYQFVTSICYEDAFGQLSIDQIKDAKFLVNVTNDGWFDGSIEPYQHMQIARMRALEAGRYLLRATNTGVTAIVSEKGKVIKVAPITERTTISAMVQPLQGLTPYAKVGDKQIIWLILLILSLLLIYQNLLKRFLFIQTVEKI